jgi:Domain of unknown function (DUF4167)
VNNNFIRSNQNKNNNNRNRNRNNNSSRRNTGGGTGGGGPNNKVFDSNGPDIKLRGTTQTIAEKYMQLGRDSQSSGDSVAAENYYQHAEHYYRMWAASQPVGHSLQMSRKLGEEEFEEEGDDQVGADDEGEGGSVDAPQADANQPGEAVSGEQSAAGLDNQPPRQNRNNNFRDNNNRDNNNRNFRPRWPNNRNNRNSENREGGNISDTAPQAVTPEAPAEFVQAAPTPVSAEAEGQWEAPSFLQRPAPMPSDVSETPNVLASDAPPPRKPRARKPRVEAETPVDDGSSATE